MRTKASAPTTSGIQMLSYPAASARCANSTHSGAVRGCWIGTAIPKCPFTITPPVVYHSMLGGLAPRLFPNYARLSHRKYGHRVGLFRLLDVLEKHGLQATVAMDALTAEPYPYVVRHDLQRGCEIIGHGLSASRMSTRTMSESAERDDIQTAMETLARAT